MELIISLPGESELVDNDHPWGTLPRDFVEELGTAEFYARKCFYGACTVGIIFLYLLKKPI